MGQYESFEAIVRILQLLPANLAAFPSLAKLCLLTGDNVHPLQDVANLVKLDELCQLAGIYLMIELAHRRFDDYQFSTVC
jgi:hypothetical protein